MKVGISGLAVYTPALRVSLKDWCEWTGNSWGKVSAVVGHGFRQPGAHESIYTMAANAVLRLIEQYDIDPQDVGFLGFGTESSTDNAAGAVIIRGMLDRALDALGRPRLSRACEVPEFKHACLGGVYALKSALRYVASDGRGRKAIVVCGDIAEYERGSSGEQTQGAGAVAMLVEEDPKLCTIDLSQAGSSSDYRALDFRKPVSRHFAPEYTPNVHRLHDFPVFNGRYSTFCYLDAVASAASAMFDRNGLSPSQFYDTVEGIFMHRPYHRMPVSGLATLYVWGLASHPGCEELGVLAEQAGVSLEAVLSEVREDRDLMAGALADGLNADPYPNISAVAKVARKSEAFLRLQREKMHLGCGTMQELGNLYTAALPAWLAAGFEEAAASGRTLANQTLLLVGYGSGDAAECIPVTVVDGWEAAANRIAMASALEGAIDLTQAQYEARHDGEQIDLPYEPQAEFIVASVGQRVDPSAQDIGIEYYQYVPSR